MQLAALFLERQVDRQSELIADVYLDSLSSAAVLALDTGDIDTLRMALRRALGFQVGVVDRIIVVGLPDGSVLARAGAADADPPMMRGELGRLWEVSNDGRMAWAQREVIQDGRVVALAAVQLAFPELTEGRRVMRWRLLVACALLAVVVAALASNLARRLMAPFVDVARVLEGVAAGDAGRSGVERMSEAERLRSALEHMMVRVRTREELAARLAEQERSTVLARLAATVAHEVRNPLAGMLTTIDTLRHFGEDRAVRQRSLDLLERALRQVEAVVRATLATHRERESNRPVTQDDLDDLKALVGPEARRGDVTLDWRVRIDTPFRTDAVRLRQIVLNLLLNAVAATRPGATVGLEAFCENGTLHIRVDDEAGGMPDAEQRRLSGGISGDPGGGLGLEIVGRLTASLGGAISIQQRAAGTRIVLRLPEQRGTAP
jgi:signal transduction histidine kinase